LRGELHGEGKRLTEISRLKDASSHFAFGKNWASYAELIDEPQIEASKKWLLKLIPAEKLVGRSFLDVGCGSGLHVLAATELGVNRILAVDIDADSVSTCKALLTDEKVTVPWHAEVVSVFDLDADRFGTFDVVYSWGVLHHTGAMWEAVEKAASMVAPNGLLAIALYRTTYLDPFWKFEKCLYARAPKPVQRAVSALYIAAYRLALLATGRSYRAFIENYKSVRGMDFPHDVHDWLGGYPYESALAPEVDRKLEDLGFKAERVFARPISHGLLGSGCDEYVYRRVS
jgi:2-polyprenyl-6-hydroxyphenyl methylase/3-demethylubiquinone-9 3-methyltransferase